MELRFSEGLAGATRKLKLAPLLLLGGLAVLDLAWLPEVRCVFLSCTGLPCPLCGMTRALHAWMHFEPVAAMGFHALSPLVLAVLAAVGMGVKVPGWWWTAMGIAIGVFGLFRAAIATL